MANSEDRSFSVSNSWRMVDGDGNDSFDTSVVRAMYDDDIDEQEDFIPCSQPESQFTNPASSFGPALGSASQDSVSNYLNTADDEHLLSRTGAFRPSVPPAARKRISSREQSFTIYDEYRDRTPEPQLMFPKVEVESPRLGGGSRSTTSSTRTVRPFPGMASAEVSGFRWSPRVRGNSESPLKPRRVGRQKQEQEEVPAYYSKPAVTATRDTSIRDRLATSIPHGMLDVAGWLFKIVGWAFNMLAPIFSIILALLLLATCSKMIWTYYRPSVISVVSPICKIPGAGLLNIPLCQRGDSDDKTTTRGGQNLWQQKTNKNRAPIEFDDLISVQCQLEYVLEESSTAVSLPLEMKRSEASIRDLRTLVKTSELEAKDSLVLEFNGFIDATSKSADELTQFTVDVGTAVDRILFINKHTMRFISDLLPHDTDGGGGKGGVSLSLMINLVLHHVLGIRRWVPAWNEDKIRQKYLEHTSSVAERVHALVVQAQVVLRELDIAEGHLEVIFEIIATELGTVQDKKKDAELQPVLSLWTLWRMVGGSSRGSQASSSSSLQTQLDLLRSVGLQRSLAVDKLTRLVIDLKEMQSRLADLRDRVVAPGLVGVDDGGGRNSLSEVPLKIHIETINRGIERLESARLMIRSEEEDRVREAVRRGRPDDILIEDK